MVDHVLSTRLAGSCSPKLFNNDIVVPRTRLGAGGGDDYVICEVGSNAPGEIASLARIIKPDIAVVTSIAQAHLEKLGSLERIASEKASLLGWLGPRGLAVVWGDSDELDTALKSYPRRMIRFGCSGQAQLRLTGYKPDGQGQRFEINDHQWTSLSLPGRHNAINALAAIAVCMKFGFSQTQAIEALANFAGVEMRLEQIDLAGLRIINDAYNANPASCRAAIDVLVDCPAQRRVFVIGDMLELGQASEKLHAELGRHLASQPVDVIVGVGPGGKIVAKNAGEAGQGKQITLFDDTPAAAAGIANLLATGDVVLLKGSRAMGLERLINAVRTARQGRGKP
jgi:UDP-N-acetylmuramoyl-tripeptide--D-alanyl-D-alanine ligase